MSVEQLLIFLAAGLAMGLLSGSFGVGGGVIIVPALVLIFAKGQQEAQGLSLMAMVPIAIAGAAGYLLHPKAGLDWRIAAVIGVAGVCGSLIGTRIAHSLPGEVLRKWFAVFLVICAVIMYFRDDLFKKHAATHKADAAKGAEYPHANPSQ